LAAAFSYFIVLISYRQDLYLENFEACFRAIDKLKSSE